MSLRRLHLLDSRSTAFREDDVLQENIIVPGGTVAYIGDTEDKFLHLEATYL